MQLVRVYLNPVDVIVKDGLTGQELWEAAEEKVFYLIDGMPEIDSIEVVGHV